ncbi:MAG: cobalamin-binding protein [Bacteroidota bacterium]|nr:cobalamin-binding protein [Bacteroidota bacterium]
MRISFFLLLFTLIGCSSDRSKYVEPFLKVKDDLGREVLIKEKPNRIISLAPNITEILFALDNGKTLSAVTDYCDYPSAVSSKPSIGGMIAPNFEKISEIKPDLILMTVEGNNQTDFNKLLSLGYTVYVLKPKNVEGIFKSILDLGRIISAEGSANQLIIEMRKKQSVIMNGSIQKSKPKVFIVISLQPLISAGRETFINELITSAGGINIAAESPLQYPIINREEVLKQNPDVIIVMSDVVKSIEDVVTHFPEWKKTEAFKKQKIKIIDADILSRPGPRIIDGLKMIASVIF